MAGGTEAKGGGTRGRKAAAGAKARPRGAEGAAAPWASRSSGERPRAAKVAKAAAASPSDRLPEATAKTARTDETPRKGRKPEGRHPVNRLKAVQVERLGPGRHADGNGLYLEVDPTGARRWVLRTVVRGKRRDIGLGSTMLVTLAEAREKARTMRATARAGGDPLAERRRAEGLTFADAARKVHAERMTGAKNGKHVAQWIGTLETYAFPTMGEKRVADVTPADVLAVLEPIWNAKPETARRVRQRLKAVFDWALTAGHREARNPVEGVEKGLPKQADRVEHHAALPWAELPGFWPRLVAAPGMGALALRFAILTAARSGEVRGMTWGEVEGEAWTIPASRMKAKAAHRVPLSAEALAILGEARALAGEAPAPGALVFPGQKRGKPLSDMTLAAVLKRLGLDVTPHGFRSTFRDWAEEAGDWPREVKEAALAHAVANKVEAAYRRGD